MNKLLRVYYDSRTDKKGYIFVCVKGYRTDGHLYIDDALSRGAVGLVVERDVEVPQGISLVRVEDSRRPCPIVSKFLAIQQVIDSNGVTSTNGKTTVLI